MVFISLLVVSCTLQSQASPLALGPGDEHHHQKERTPAAAAAAAGSDDLHYLRLAGIDSTCQQADLSLRRVSAGVGDEADADEGHGGRAVRAACNADPECLGYNNRGVLKQRLHPECLTKQHGSVLYRKTRHRKTIGLSPVVPIVPLPESWHVDTGNSVLQGDFNVTTTSTDPDVRQFIDDAVERYWGLVVTHRSSPPSFTGGLTALEIAVSSNSLALGLGTDESYELIVPSEGTARLTAATVFGVVHGMETLSQLIQYDYLTGVYHIVNTPLLVTDKPRFAHRGILLDTSRHYHSVGMLKRFLDSMSHAKLNVFHWHIVDIQSFPMQFRTLPKLVQGAFTPHEVYTPGDVMEIVRYARARAIRVVPEFDTPGHAASWCVGYPNVCPSPSCTTPLNPATNDTFDLISTLITESKGLWPDDYMHLGGDEVRANCWESVPAVANWLKEKNYTTDDAYGYFVKRTHALARSLGRKSIHWEEVFNHFGGALDKDTIFQVWLSHKTAAKIVAEGYQCILSNSDTWYLPHLSVSWEKMYMNDPFMGITDPKQQKLMLGGEACMWGETVDDSDLFNTVWPRAAAVAERLWSPVWANSTGSFLPRLVRFRCLLNMRGYGAAAVHNDLARSAPPGPGSCEFQ